jgi:pimeloyl-ACP methyl ester carboxylesterase
MELRTGDVAAVLDALGIERAHYWGYSMGGRTGFAMAQFHPQRLLSLIVGAAAPTSPRREEARIRRGAEALESGDLKEIAAAFFVTEAAAARMLEGNDPLALAAAQLGLLTWDGVDPATVGLRSLLYAGSQDVLAGATKAAADAMPDVRFESLPGLNHLTGFVQSSAVLPKAVAFLG